MTGRKPHYVAVTGPPSSFAVLTTPDSKSAIEAMLPTDTRWENRVAGRIILRMGFYRPGRRAAKVVCPLLVCVCDRDVLAPGDRTVAMVSKAPRVEIKRYPVGHFDIYVGDAFDVAVADQIDFLTRHLVARDTLRAEPSA